MKNSSRFIGVCRHIVTGRYEAHFWDSQFVAGTQRCGGRSRGKQMYLGGYLTETEAARAVDMAILKFRGKRAKLNFPLRDYLLEMEFILGSSRDEFLSFIRLQGRRSTRGDDYTPGVTQRQPCGRWEARIGGSSGGVGGTMYLGGFCSKEEAVAAYDRAALELATGTQLGGEGQSQPGTPPGSERQPEPSTPPGSEGMECELRGGAEWGTGLQAACDGGLNALLGEPWECRCVLSPVCDGEACEPPVAEAVEQIDLWPVCQDELEPLECLLQQSALRRRARLGAS